MLTLYVESGNTLLWEAGSVKVVKAQKLTKRVPVSQLEAIWINGKVGLDSTLLTKLTSNNVAVTICPARGSSKLTHISHVSNSGARLRIAQHTVWHDKSRNLQIAKLILQCKLNGYLIASSHPVLIESQEKSNFIDQLARGQANIVQCHRYPELLGFEGAIAKAWFTLLKCYTDKRFKFSGRNRRPPKDPFNSLLSLSYGINLTDIENAVNSRGFDPAFGFLHELLPGRSSLALDLLEPFRPLLDVFCLNLMQISLDPDDFYYETNGACKLRKEKQRLYFGQLHAFRLDPWIEFSLSDTPNLWPGEPIHFDGESLIWLARQLCEKLAIAMLAISKTQTEEK